MVKREYQEMDDVDANEYSPSAKTAIKTESQASNETISSAEIISTPKKKSRSKAGEEGGSKTPKSKSPPKSVRWSPSEDETLIAMMEKVIKDQIWALAKADGRLVSRGSYGVQYHALMLLRQGTGKGSK